MHDPLFPQGRNVNFDDYFMTYGDILTLYYEGHKPPFS